MLAEGGHYWNAGIFLMRADRFLAELERQQPAMAAACAAAMDGAHIDGAQVHPDADAFLSSLSDSIDYAVLEGAGRRSAERSVGKECVSTGRSRGAPSH